MTTDHIEPYEIVRVGDGKRVIPVAMFPRHYGNLACEPGGLKKDGTPKLVGGGPFQHMLYPTEKETRWLHQWTRYLPEREAKAQPIRDLIAAYRLSIAAEEQALLKLYKGGAS